MRKGQNDHEFIKEKCQDWSFIITKNKGRIIKELWNNLNNE